MKFIKSTEGETYQAVDHFNMWGCMKVKEGLSSKTTVSLSHFLPDGGANMKPSTRERVYYVVTGSITVTSETQKIVLNEGDVIYIPPNEARRMSVNNNQPASVLVVVVRVD